MNATQIKTDYLAWIDKTHQFYDIKSKDTAIVEFSSPYLDNFGDNITFAIKQKDGIYYVTDEGYTVWNLGVHGIDVTKRQTKRYQVLKSLLNYYAVDFDEHSAEIYIKSTYDKLAQNIHLLNEVLIKINDLSFLNRHAIKSLFQDDVLSYFNANKNMYTFFPGFMVVGKSRLLHNMDYVFNTHDGQKMVKLHRNLEKQNVESTLVSWLDTHEYRMKQYGEGGKLSVLISGEKTPKSDYIIALNEYKIDVIDFSKKQEVQNSLKSVPF